MTNLAGKRKRVLIIRWFRLGDGIQAGLVGKKLRALGKEVTMMGQGSLANLFKSLGFCDHFLTAPQKDVLKAAKSFTQKQLEYIFKHKEQLFDCYDEIYNFHSEEVVMLFGEAIKKFNPGAVYADRTHLAGKLGTVSVIMRRLTAMNLVDYWSRIAGIDQFVSLESAKSRDTVFIAKKRGTKLVLVQPASADPFRSPEIDVYEACLEAFEKVEPEVHFVFIGKTDEQQILRARIKKRENLEWYPDLDLDQLADLIGQADLLITPDTGPMHLASAMNIPTLSFFMSNSDPVFTSAYTAGSVIVYFPLDCAPCNRPENCQMDFLCKKTPRGDVFKQIASFLFNQKNLEQVEVKPGDPMLLMQTEDFVNNRMLPLPIWGNKEKSIQYQNRLIIAGFFWSLLNKDDALAVPFAIPKELEWQQTLSPKEKFKSSGQDNDTLAKYLEKHFSYSLSKIKFLLENWISYSNSQKKIKIESFFEED